MALPNKTSEKVKIENRLRSMREQTKRLRRILHKYPYKDISEYTRLISQIDQFLEYGMWHYYNEETGEEGESVK